MRPSPKTSQRRGANLVHFPPSRLWDSTSAARSANIAANLKAAFQHETRDWVTLLTCEGFNERSGRYTYRRMVRAVLVQVKQEGL